MSAVRASQGFPLSVVLHTDVGMVRNNNEDAYGHAWLDDDSLWVMVADGMGGHEAGEVASNLSIQVVEEWVAQDPQGDPRQRLYDALIEANAAILDEAGRSGKHGMGTTAVAAIVRGNEVYVALVGDSRCYHFRNGRLLWRSLDHTRVQMLIDEGQLDERDARDHPEAGMLTRALGHAKMADGEDLVPDVISDPLVLEESDVVLLCSDGLTDLVDDDEIARTLAGRSGDESAQMLVDMACDRGGHDNVTVAVLVAGARAGEYAAEDLPSEETDEAPRDWKPNVATTGVMRPPDEIPTREALAAAEPQPAVAEPEPEQGSNTLVLGLVAAVLGVMLLGGVAVAAVLGLWFFAG